MANALQFALCLTHEAALHRSFKVCSRLLWRWLAHLELRTHFLDLRGLLFELRRENFHSFLLLRDCGLQLPAIFLCSLRNSLSNMLLICS